MTAFRRRHAFALIVPSLAPTLVLAPVFAQQAWKRKLRAAKKIIGVTFAGLLAIAAWSSNAEAAPEKTPSLKLLLGSASADVIALVAQSKGYFHDEGVEVSIDLSTSTTSAPMVLSNQADLVAVSSVAPVNVASQGGDTKIIYAAGGGFVAGYVVGAKGVASLADLQKMPSCKIATSPKGTGVFGAATLLKKEYSLNCELIEFGDHAGVSNAVASGTAQAAVGNLSFFNSALEAGKVTTLADTTTPQGRSLYHMPPFPEVVYWGVGRNLNTKRPALERWIKAMNRARADISKMDASSLSDIMGGTTVWKDATAAVRLINAQSFKAYLDPGSDNGYISPSAWQGALTAFEQFSIPKYSSTDPKFSYATRVDMSYFKDALGIPGN